MNRSILEKGFWVYWTVPEQKFYQTYFLPKSANFSFEMHVSIHIPKCVEQNSKQPSKSAKSPALMSVKKHKKKTFKKTKRTREFTQQIAHPLPLFSETLSVHNKKKKPQ